MYNPTLNPGRPVISRSELQRARDLQKKVDDLERRAEAALEIVEAAKVLQTLRVLPSESVIVPGEVVLVEHRPRPRAPIGVQSPPYPFITSVDVEKL